MNAPVQAVVRQVVAIGLASVRLGGGCDVVAGRPLLWCSGSVGATKCKQTTRFPEGIRSRAGDGSIGSVLHTLGVSALQHGDRRIVRLRRRCHVCDNTVGAEQR